MRDQDAAWRRRTLYPRGDIDGIAKEVLSLDKDIARMNTGTQPDCLRIDVGKVGRAHHFLDGDGAIEGFGRRSKFDQRAIAQKFDNAPIMSGNRRGDNFAIKYIQGRQQTGRTSLHHAAEPYNIQ